MRITSRAAGFAAGLALVAGLAVGVSSPAAADPLPRPVVPSCATLLPASDFTSGHIMYRWSRYTPSTRLYGATSSTIKTWIRTASISRTCSWHKGTSTVKTATISVVHLSASRVAALVAYYASIGSVGTSHGGEALTYYVPNKTHPTWIELHTLFSNGTLVATLDRSGLVNGAMMQDAVDSVITRNPWIN